jgi:hypothetical protein
MRRIPIEYLERWFEAIRDYLLSKGAEQVGEFTFEVDSKFGKVKIMFQGKCTMAFLMTYVFEEPERATGYKLSPLCFKEEVNAAGFAKWYYGKLEPITEYFLQELSKIVERD